MVDPKIVGGVGFHDPPENCVIEIGYGIVPSARKHRLATDAERQIIGIARVNGVRSVIARTETTNPASVRVLGILGMRFHSQSGDIASTLTMGIPATKGPIKRPRAPSGGHFRLKCQAATNVIGSG